MKNNIKAVISLTAICMVVSFLLALTNSITAPVIKKQESDAVNETLTKVLPEGKDFAQVDLSKYELPETVKEAYSEASGGYVFKLETAGYNSGLVLMCGVNAEGIVAGTAYISGSETLGYETTYGEKLVNATADTIDSVDTVAGATKTTAAYKNAVKDSLNSAIILSGGEADIRSEDQKLNDSLKEALPESDGKFSKVFITEEIGDISAVYKADNNIGYVFLLGDNFIATDAEGTVASSVDADISTLVSDAAQKIIKSTMTQIDIASYPDMPPHVQKAYKTLSGNYVFELRAAGYGINGDKYQRSGEYIYIRTSVTADGKIISCETLSQSETKGIGDACAKPEFYSQFNGKSEIDYKDVDAITGATITTNGYLTAVSKVFEAVNILKGGA